MLHTYPAEYPVRPATGPIAGEVTVPGSKSITNRALALAALGSRGGTDCLLTGALHSEDTEVMVESLDRLGFDVRPDWDAAEIFVGKNRTARVIPAKSADLFAANSGTSVRFLAALCAAGTGTYRLDGVERMRERPIQDLLDALTALGVTAKSEPGTGCPPVLITSGGLAGGEVAVKADTSSQFLSALLMAGPAALGPLTVRVPGPVVSEPYIAMTVAMMREWGYSCEQPEPGVYHTRPEHPANPAEYDIEPDASAASYFFAAAAVTGGRVTVNGTQRNMPQGDIRFLELLERMGCRVEECDAGLTLHGKPLTGIDADLNAVSDTMMTLAAVACFAAGPTTIRNVAHVRHKETDRIAATAAELRKLGAEVEEFPDGLRITPKPLTGCAVDTYRDHRMAMSLAVVGLKVPGVIIRDPGCVAKTYPGFWDDWERLTGSGKLAG